MCMAFAKCSSLRVDPPLSFGLLIRAQHFSQPQNFIQLVRMRGFKTQCNMNIAKPWMELKIQKKYWNTTLASAIARNPNTQVTPVIGNVNLIVHGGFNNVDNKHVVKKIMIAWCTKLLAENKGVCSMKCFFRCSKMLLLFCGIYFVVWLTKKNEQHGTWAQIGPERCFSFAGGHTSTADPVDGHGVKGSIGHDDKAEW